MQATSQLYLRQGLQANSNMKASISLEEAERMMRDTTMFTQSVISGHQNRSFLFGYECPLEMKWVILGMEVAIWIAAVSFVTIWICCDKNSFG